jgi:hypothetical protein
LRGFPLNRLEKLIGFLQRSLTGTAKTKQNTREVWCCQTPAPSHAVLNKQTNDVLGIDQAISGLIEVRKPALTDSKGVTVTSNALLRMFESL